MPESRKIILKPIMSGTCTKINHTKQLPADIMETGLKRYLNTFNITLMGVGQMAGAGIYILTGTVAKDIVKPWIAFSLFLIGIASLLLASCCAEFGTRTPKVGSVCIHTYLTIGEFWAFVIGWNLLMEHIIGVISVTHTWTGYIDTLFDGIFNNKTITLTDEMYEQLFGHYLYFLVFTVCVAYASLLMIDVKGSTNVMNLLTTITLFVIAIVIIVVSYYADKENGSLEKGDLSP